jgi:mono/diheme cytochrome c family protein
VVDVTNPIERRCSFHLLRMDALISLSHSAEFRVLGWLFILFTATSGGLVASAQEENDATDLIGKGRYIVHASNCISCHTNFKNNGPLLGGGRAIVTTFGTFFSPNITTDPMNGIGKWTFENFRSAMIKGVSPQGYHYYPVFPYTSYSGITMTDLEALWSYLKTVPPSAVTNRRHQIHFPFSFRPALLLWKKLFFAPVNFQSNPEKSREWNRGFYLVGTLGHCRECHTPRNLFGAMNLKASYSGTKLKATGVKIPNITPDLESGLGAWDKEDITWFLKTGLLPDGDAAGGIMAEIIDRSTSFLTPSDRNSIATFLNSLAPIHNPSLIEQNTIDNSEENW